MSTQFLDLEEAQRQLGFKNINTLRRMCRRGELKAYKLGNTYKTTQAWIDDCLAKKLVQVSQKEMEA